MKDDPKKKHADLRDSGYKGWINQDGDPVNIKGAKVDPKDPKHNTNRGWS